MFGEGKPLSDDTGRSQANNAHCLGTSLHNPNGYVRFPRPPSSRHAPCVDFEAASCSR